jgi:hypothetical protein
MDVLLGTIIMKKLMNVDQLRRGIEYLEPEGWYDRAELARRENFLFS